MGKREKALNDRIDRLIAGFDRYVDHYGRNVGTGNALTSHTKTIARRRMFTHAADAVTDDVFVEELWKTLRCWGVGVRASRLGTEEDFRAKLRAHRDAFAEFETLHIDSCAPKAADRLMELIKQLDIVQNKSKIVAGSKILHHILPELVPPMDRRWTSAFFNNEALWSSGQDGAFRDMLVSFARIAEETDPTRYVRDDGGWHTCLTKILDNALIGFRQIESADGSDRIVLQVDGLPPARGRSLFGDERSVKLLKSASGVTGFTLVGQERWTLDLTLFARPDEAVDYLGGVLDVLGDKTKLRGEARELGDLVNMQLYGDEQRPRELSYHEAIPKDEPHYTVTLRRRGRPAA